MTDFWLRKELRALRNIFPRTASRFREEIDDSVVSCPLFSNPKRLFAFLLSKHSCWEGIFRRNQAYGLSVAESLKRQAFHSQFSVFFSYAYSSHFPFKYLAGKGVVLLLGQMDPGPSEYSYLNQLGLISEPQNIPHEKYWRDWYEEVRLADRIIVNSEWSLSLLRESGIDDEKILVIPLAMDRRFCNQPKVFPTAFSQERPLILLYIGQVIPRKGIFKLLEALAEVELYHISLIVAGPIRCEIPAKFRTQGNVQFLGPVSKSKVDDLFSFADVFIFPTFSDAFGITQLEALSHRIPAIVSSNCAKVFEHDKNAIVLERVTKKGLTDAIMLCYKQPKLLERFSAYRADLYSYSINRLSKDLCDLVSAVEPGLYDRQ